MVSGAIFAHYSTTIYSKDYRQFLQGNIVDDLVEGPLQEGGIDRYHWLVSCHRQSRCKGHRMLLGNAHIKKPMGKFFSKQA